MAKRYRPVNRDQPFLLPPDMRDWLPEDDPVWLVIRVIEDHLDTSAFHAARRAGGAGAAGYDPDMLLTVLAWAYAHRVTSSRRIEQLCRTDVAFRVICGGSLPDHATIARFRAAFPGAVAGLFAEVLRLCARLGMGRLGVVALDGTKVAASASKSANRAEDKLARLAEETVAAHAAADAAEDALLGAARGDEVPEGAWSPRSRDSRIAAALASLRAEAAAEAAGRAAAADEHVRAARAGAPRPGRRPAGADVEVARLGLARATAAQQAKAGAWRARQAERAAAGLGPGKGRQPKGPGESARVRRAAERLAGALARAEAAAARAAAKEKDRQGPGPARNLTDPDSRLMPVRGGGFIQGYNAQNVTTADGLITATELTADTGDVTWYQPMTGQAEDAAAIIAAQQPPPPDSPGPGGGPGGGQPPASGDAGEGRAGPIGLVLADAGYLSEANLTCPGPDRLIATGKHRDLEKAARDPGTPGSGPPPGGEPGAGAIAAMAARLKTPDGIAAYRQRGHIAETPHGHIKENMGFRQLSMRGKPKATAEWTFACIIHNLTKAITSGRLTTAALDNLATPA